MNAGSKSRSFENYPRDIVDRVIDEYPADAIGQVHLWLEDLASDRLSRCALFLAAGSLKKLEEEVALGRTDYRDLIVAADYDRFLIQLRDFNRPFGEEAVPNPLEFQMRRSQPNKRSGPTT
jgi:hypothetical protein